MKHTAEPFKRSAEISKHSVELLKSLDKIKSSAEGLKSSVACLCYNSAHAVLIGHGAALFLFELNVAVLYMKVKFISLYLHMNLNRQQNLLHVLIFF